MVSLWIKTLSPGSHNSTQTNFEIDCSAAKIKSLGSVRYTSGGIPIGSTREEDWQVIVPETIGETLRNDMCGKP